MYDVALNKVEERIKMIRKLVKSRSFDKESLAEVEINKFFYNGEAINRVMVVLRANGCEHYKESGGCSMCAHFNGTPDSHVTDEEYKKQWDSLINGTFIEDTESKVKFNLDDYPVVCVYNLGSMLNEKEISLDAVRYIFSSLNNYKKVKKVIIESRAEFVNEQVLEKIKEVYDGIVEIGIGVESTVKTIRQLCHHKRLEDESTISNAVNLIHKYGFKALAYINLKPVFLTEQEAIDDGVSSAIDCFNMNFDAVSIEPTSLQEYSLANFLHNIGEYRVSWLWSVREVVRGIYKLINCSEKKDIRLGGYFDENVLSGSQGASYSERNEIFPHMTSSNCSKCTDEFVQRIKSFNMTYDIKVLDEMEECPECYSLWEGNIRVKDSRSIEQRIIDTLN
ncbi:MAG: hypothetical protein A2Y24_08780 [Clostridiales bacterium GWE2_32_10]|nr:MAG: hypothetical protein A2Y24_08780 [Clostridiales bacterium GWE2_32_10]